MKRRKTVFCAMSGGVDSSVAAGLLSARGGSPPKADAPREHAFGGKTDGFDVVGIFMKNWTGPSCTAGEDYESAAMAANALGIPIYSWNFEKEYKEKVFGYMLREYAKGRTPNPDVMCNREIKFGAFFDRAVRSGADFVATGHYARRAENRKGKIKNSCYSLLAGVDSNKDQSYFLWTLAQDKLAKTLFPVGDYTKPQVRQMAHKLGLPNADRKDSQGLCFVGKVDFREFLTEYVMPKPGPVMTSVGKVLGEHGGVEFYTVGQRHGIGIGGGTPYYVTEKDPTRNALYVAEGKDDPALYSKELAAAELNWISGTAPAFPLSCYARIRYRQPLQPCTVMLHVTGYMLHVIFDEPQRAVAPGQSVVFYNGDEMLGGGVIEK